jgi:quercetin dioxygenase-like cupin family protein
VADEIFVAMNTERLPWADSGSERPGTQVKVLRRYDEDDYALDCVVRYPPGHVEARRTDATEEMVMVVEGQVLVDDKNLGPGDYIYAPRGAARGPFEYPEGAVLYISSRGGPDSALPGDAGGELLVLRTDDIPWIDAKELIELPPGLEVKVLRHDPADDNARDLLVHFPPGYVEPRHMHPGSHNNVILQGRMLIDGKTLDHGDYVYGPGGVWHGRFEYPDGIFLCAFHRGDPRHIYEGKEQFYPAPTVSS